jgi:methyl-accepting chemotaxis protein
MGTWLRQLSIKRRLYGFGAMCLGAVLLSAAALLGTGQRLESSASGVFDSKDLVADLLPPPMYLVELRLVVSRTLEGALNPEAGAKEVERLEAEYAARAKHWQEHPIEGLSPQALNQQAQAAQAFLAAARETVKLAQGQGPEAARERLSALDALFATHRAGVDSVVKQANDLAAANIARFDRTVGQAKRLAWAGSALLLVAVALLSAGIARSILEPLQAASLAIERVAEGDLTHSVADGSQDELGKLARQIDAMVQSLTRLVRDVRLNAEALASASTQIAQGNQDLSSRTEQQASALQQTAATMSQLGTTVKENASFALQADQLSTDASAVAQQGGAVVGEVVQTMQGISDASKRISDIISVIDGIAFQTNILALNAAVEAARAGEQGRGFAVVASEVRSLAQRSADAAREIKGLITTSVERVEQGSSQVEKAGQTMKDIVSAITRVSQIVGEISSASQEQSAGVGQVGQAIEQMDHNTQQNAALVEESAAAAESLRQQAEEMVSAVAAFRLAAG